MIRTFFFSTLLIFFTLSSKAQFGKYNVLSIPDSLRKGADAVVREDDVVFTVKDMATATMKAHYVITILNEKDDRDLAFMAGSDKFQYLDEATINVYDAFGNKLKTYSKKDMQTASFGEGLVEDGKTTYFKVSAASYPITIEEDCIIKHKGILEYDNYVIANSGHSVQEGSYEISVPTALGLRYKAINTTLQPKISTDGLNTKYKWSAANVKALPYESHSGPSANYLPYISISPNKFQLEDKPGDFTSWKNYGDWYKQLYGQYVNLSPKYISFIQNLVKGETTDIGKAKVLYNYLQQNMRYVSIQLGIGGLRPFPADFVQEKKYGDCKALSNYMQAALQLVGVKSYSAIIKAGANQYSVSDDFPEEAFDHAILCIPQPKDSIWLECTSKYTDFGVLGDFTENRKALLITENGGVLVSTPQSQPTENVFDCRTDIMLDTDGGGKVTSKLLCKGEYKFNMVGNFNQRTDDEKRTSFIHGLGWKQPDKLDIANGDRSETPYQTTAVMDYEQLYSFKAGSKMFLPLRLYPVFSADVPVTEKRKHDYYFEHPYQLLDSTVYHLPENFSVESLPKDKNLETAFGKYTSHCVFDEAAKTVTVIAFLEITKHVVPPSKYTELLNFKKYLDEDMGEKLVVKAN